MTPELPEQILGLPEQIRGLSRGIPEFPEAILELPERVLEFVGRVRESPDSSDFVRKGRLRAGKAGRRVLGRGRKGRGGEETPKPERWNG